MNTTLLKFSSLPDAAKFVKQTKSNGYLLNTLELTIAIRLSKDEIDAAIENWNARLAPTAYEPKPTPAAFLCC